MRCGRLSTNMAAELDEKDAGYLKIMAHWSGAAGQS